MSLHKFSALRCWGRHPGNIAWELRDLLGVPNVAPVVKIDLPTRMSKPCKRTNSIASISQSFMLPHTVFNHLYHNKRQQFQKVFYGAGGESGLREFWETLVQRRDPRLLKDHPMAQRIMENNVCTVGATWRRSACNKRLVNPQLNHWIAIVYKAYLLRARLCKSNI